MIGATEILRAWDAGITQHPIDRALTLLAFRYPQLDRRELGAFTLGRRDAALLDLRAATFGDRMETRSACPHCGAPVELVLSAGAMRLPPAESGTLPAQTLQGYELRLRIPDSFDLAAAAAAGPSGARRTLLRRCVTKAAREGIEIAPEELPEEVVARIAATLAEADPPAEVLLDARCPDCAATWQVRFDIAEQLWAEIAVEAKRLLLQVHTLAGAYGWSEAQILGLSSPRRRWYVEMVSG